MLLVTTDFIPGKDPVQIFGTIHGLGVNPEGNAGDAISKANEQLIGKATELGANAVLGMRYEIATVGRNFISHVYGTAVVI